MLIVSWKVFFLSFIDSEQIINLETATSYKPEASFNTRVIPISLPVQSTEQINYHTCNSDCPDPYQFVLSQ